MGEKMVDRVVRIAKDYENIRNIAICAHIDHGKTTFSDNLLAGSGMMAEELAGKARQLDFHEDEIARGITIDAASVSMVHVIDGKEFLINLIDTPGHVDFGGDVTRAMRAVDGCIVLVDAVEGIMPQTETVLRQALRERVKPTLFINKVDRLIKELQLTPEKMQERFINVITSVNRLIKKIAEPEYGDRWQVNVQDGSVSFGSAFHNWALSIPFMQKKGITLKDVIGAYQGGGEEHKQLAKKAPLHECVLNMVVRHLPNPKQAQPYRIPKIWRGDTESDQGKALAACDPNGPIDFCITKIVVDPQAGEISAGRLFSGTMKRGTEVYLLGAKQRARIQQIFIYNGAKREIVDNVPSGNIIGIAGVKSYPGETVCSIEGEPFEQITHIFEPVVTKSIEAKRPSDLPRVIEVLRQVAKEDPSIRVEINEETGEHLMSGMGELHLEIIENRIKTEKGVDITTSNPIVVYRESILKKTLQEFEGKSPNKHNKLYFIVEPIPAAIAEMIKKGEIPEGRIKKKDLALRDKFVDCGMDTKEADKVKDVFHGNVFVDRTRGIVYIQEILEMVLDMFEDVMKSGPLAREPCINVMVSLMDCKLHEDAIHRGPAQMYPAVREGIRGAMVNANAVMFEPMQTMLFEAPEEYMGEISKLVSNKRGQLLDLISEGSMVHVKAKIPVAEMLGMSNDLRSATEGRGTSSMIDQTYEKLPEELQMRVITQIRTRKGLSENQ
ncbi:elongation factor EF-2 [Candidatus Woesearchaeota archaeon]|nr:elongation factor EF-2 [Candidatus Woesearchaeota archaeon]